MLRPTHPTDFADDPVVRQTLARLKFGMASVVCGVALCLVLAVFVANMAYQDGIRAVETAAAPAAPATPDKAQAATTSPRAATAPKAAPAASATPLARGVATAETGGPSGITWGILVGGLLAVGLLMFSIVRRPYAAARDHAIELVRAYQALEGGTLETFAALNATVEAKDRYTAGHGLRVTLISMLIAQEIGLDERDIDTLRHAATFHDIGKIAVPDSVLQKPGRLTDQEFDAMKVHPVESARICSKLAALRDSVPAIRHHHERLDGRGYPDGLAGDRIPIGARIIAVADTWDAITSDRPYRPGQPAAVALDEIRRVAGEQFDPKVVDAFVEVLAKDPWMFGLTPEELQQTPAAPGKKVEGTSRGSEDNSREGDLVTLRKEVEVDWSSGLALDEDEDLAA